MNCSGKEGRRREEGVEKRGKGLERRLDTNSEC